MGEVTVTHACGHEVRHRYEGGEGAQRQRVAWLEQQPCQVCFQAQQAEQSAAQAEALDLPALEGEEGDCAWAARIRTKIIDHNHDFYERLMRNAKKAPEEERAAHVGARAAEEAYATLAGTRDARWWIDNRFEAMNYVRDEAAKAIQAILDEER